MKTILGLAALLVFVLAPVSAQEFVAPAQEERPTRPAPDQQRISIEGIVAQIFKNPQPLQLINPLAPASYGSGEQNVSKDEGDPYFNSTGLIVLGVDW